MIQFIQPIDADRLRMAYNNDVVRFKSSFITTPAYGLVTIAGSPSVRLYPSPDGVFYFNFKPYVTALINTNNFEDTTVTDLITTVPESFIYSHSSAVLQRQVTFLVYQDSDVYETAIHSLTWLAAAQQTGSYIPHAVNQMLVLSPALPDAANTTYLKYWEGYPFDVSLYSKQDTLIITNSTNLAQEDFSLSADGATRLFFADGRTDETLEDLLPLVNGYNRLKLQRATDASADAKFILLDKAAACPGIYLKWLNAQGGYSYWLFENTYAVDRSAKSIGELDRDFENLENSFARTTQMGREVQDTLKIVAELLTDAQRNIVQNLLESPKVYLFTGAPYSRSDYHSWIEVSVKTTSARIRNPREALTNFAFDIELPVRYTQTL